MNTETRLSLPTALASNASPCARETVPAPPLVDATVMMVDDEPMMTDVIQTYLEEAGYTRLIASNAPAEHSLNCASRAIRRNTKPEKFNREQPGLTHL